MRVVILAGGRGSRLAPYTTILPKPLMPVGDKPILDIIIRQLKEQGITEITLAVGYLSELLMAYFGNGERLGVSISYSHEEEPLGTAGPLGLITDLRERFLVMNGDILCSLSINEMQKSHLASGALCTMAVHRREIPINLGVIDYDEKHRVKAYIEKPMHFFQASMGIYLFEPSIGNFIPKNQKLDLPDLVNKLIHEGEHVNCYPFNGYWLDIGRPDDHAKANADIEENPRIPFIL
jgi:NDP-sugar pyrophosphorylase family protein